MSWGKDGRSPIRWHFNHPAIVPPWMQGKLETGFLDSLYLILEVKHDRAQTRLNVNLSGMEIFCILLPAAYILFVIRFMFHLPPEAVDGTFCLLCFPTTVRTKYGYIYWAKNLLYIFQETLHHISDFWHQILRPDEMLQESVLCILDGTVCVILEQKETNVPSWKTWCTKAICQ